VTDLQGVLESYIGNGAGPGAVALVAGGERVEIQAVGPIDIGGTASMLRDSIFRVASITKPITAAAVMTLVEDDRIALEEPVERWYPFLI
jgi:CubicO group peptidase (beta-lactamase class C family)